MFKGHLDRNMSWSWISQIQEISFAKNERSMIQAIINKCFLKNEIKRFKEMHGLKQGTGTLIQQARSDAVELGHGRKVKLKEIKRQQK